MSADTALYPRLLRLRGVHPNTWQRMLLVEGVLALAGLLVLADLASAWTLLVLPLTVTALVKLHDLVALHAGGPGDLDDVGDLGPQTTTARPRGDGPVEGGWR